MSATTTIRVMPIWTLERKRDWLSSRRNAARAPALPFSAMAARRGRREETTASSAMAKKPFSTIRQATTPSSRASMRGPWQEEDWRSAPGSSARCRRRDGLAPANKTDRAEGDWYDQNNGRSTRLPIVPTSALRGRLRHRCPRSPKPAEQPRQQEHDDHRRNGVPNTRVDPVHDLVLRCLAAIRECSSRPHTPRHTHQNTGSKD